MEVLGGFKPSPPNFHPGWILKVTSRFNKTWFLLVYPPAVSKDPTVVVKPADYKVPWELYQGDSDPKAGPLIRGDYPQVYRKIKQEYLDKDN